MVAGTDLRHLASKATFPLLGAGHQSAHSPSLKRPIRGSYWPHHGCAYCHSSKPFQGWSWPFETPGRSDLFCRLSLRSA